MPAPLVSILIPCHNAERWIGAAIESALAQTWPAIEVIVVDDGSSDGSARVIEAFGERVRFERGANRGGNAARNRLLQLARGEWVQYLDADDYLEPEKIAAQFAETPELGNVEAIYSPVWVEEGTRREFAPPDPEFDIYARWFAWQLPQTGGCLWRREALEKLSGWNKAIPCCQEHELYARALQAGMRFHFAPTPHAVYRIWSDDTVCRRDPRRVVEIRTGLFDEMAAWLRANGLWREQHHAVASRACFEMARTLARDDLDAASRYTRERRQCGLFRPAGPAAPITFRLCAALLGFRCAERIARLIR